MPASTDRYISHKQNQTNLARRFSLFGCNCSQLRMLSAPQILFSHISLYTQIQSPAFSSSYCLKYITLVRKTRCPTQPMSATEASYYVYWAVVCSLMECRLSSLVLVCFACYISIFLYQESTLFTIQILCQRAINISQIDCLTATGLTYATNLSFSISVSAFFKSQLHSLQQAVHFGQASHERKVCQSLALIIIRANLNSIHHEPTFNKNFQ